MDGTKTGICRIRYDAKRKNCQREEDMKKAQEISIHNGRGR